MADAQAVVERYLEVWNSLDAVERGKAAAEVFTDGCRFVDPIAEVTGPDGVAAVVGGVHERFPGHRLELLGAVDAHHDVVRFSWQLLPVGSDESVVIGTDVLVLTEDGRVGGVHGFFDKVPAM